VASEANDQQPRRIRQGGSRRDGSPIEPRGRTSRHPRLEKAVNAAEALAEARRGLKGHNPGNN